MTEQSTCSLRLTRCLDASNRPHTEVVWQNPGLFRRVQTDADRVLSCVMHAAPHSHPHIHAIVGSCNPLQ